jgi:cytoskeletal protein CcmA (bactofilin family)
MAAPRSTQGPASVIAESAVITGRVTGDGDLEVRGRIEGELAIRGDVVIAESALIRATIAGARVTIRGAVLGDVSGTDAVVLEASARVVGNLRAPRIAVALGAQIRGDLDMGEVPAIAPTATRAAAAARPQAQVARRPPPPPARPVVVTRSAPAQQQVAPPPSQPAAHAAERKGPPEPVVPAIKKGAKAVAKKKG